MPGGPTPSGRERGAGRPPKEDVAVLAGTRGLVLGVANRRSIAWGIAQAAGRAGAELALTYQGERLKESVEELAATVAAGTRIYPCDVTRDEEIDSMFARIREDMGTLDFLVHSVAYANREDLDGSFSSVSRDGYRIAHEVSTYSLVALARRAAPLMEGRPGAILTMTYLGGERVVPNYNIMGVAKAALEACVRYLAAELGPRGVRVNAISAGPIKTLAAAGISGFKDMLRTHEQRAPLRRNTEVEEVSDAAVFLLSRMARGITGEVLYVDGGFHILGV
jgi:enoyl-[acyl-carrier protein] reductase I